jgi:DNA-directed RNA polymerase beta' subunit
VNGGDLRVGDYLPVSRKPLEFTQNVSLDMMKILDPKEYVYGTEYAKAKSVVDEFQWWSKHANKTFVLPYRRSDTAYCSIKGGDPKKPSKERVHYEPGFVYTLKNSICNYRVPETIELDYDFGYFIGAYCAEGCMTDHQISIANNDPAYFEPIERLCKKFVLTTKYYVHKINSETGQRVKNSEDPNLWTSSDLRIYSTIMCRIVEKLAGKLSHNKFVSDHIIFSNKECLHGFLDAYIGGDGCVQTSKTFCITASSVSYRMLSDVQLMLRLLGIVSQMIKHKKPDHNSRGTLPENIHQLYELRITNQSCKRFADMLNLKIAYKQNGVELLRNHKFELVISRKDLLLPNKVDDVIEMQPRDGAMMDLAFEKVVSIEEIPNTTPYAYDLTVEETRTFDCRNGVCVFDTFHNAGVASKSNVTRGVPRIEEILRLTKHPKNPSLTVHLKALDEDSQEKAKKFANMLEHTRLSDVVKSVQICFDPDEHNTKIEEDRLLVEQFYEFSRLVEECNGPSDPAIPYQKSKWIVRMEMETEMLLDKNITMDDIHFAIKHGSYSQEVECVYSDYNADKLVFRLRMMDSSASKKKKVAEPLDQSDEIYLLKRFQDDLLNNTVLRGIQHIDNVIPRKLQNIVTKNDGKYEKKDVWILDTTGTNLMEALGLDYIDSTRTYSNDIKEIFDVLGLEAARQVIHNELVEVMEFSGVYINYHHVSLLCDRMTTNKDMVSIFRTGLFNDDIGPIAKATFEVHTEVLLDAARYGEFDHMRGVSANVMCGQNGFYGTNAFQLVLDLNEMSNLEDQLVETESKRTQIDQAFSSGREPESDQCPRTKIEMRNNIANMKRVDPGLCNDGYDGGF